MKNKKLRISILTPIYNVEKYIARCAISLMEQTYADIEYIFVDDNSHDESLNVLNSVLIKYPERSRYVKLILHEVNRGVSVARNTLLDNATGDYLLWVDADDYIEMNTVSELVKQLTNDEDILLFGAVKHTKRHQFPYMWKSENNPTEFILDLLDRRTHSGLWGRVMKRSLFEQNNIRFHEGINVGEDLIVLIKLAYASKVIKSYKPNFYHYNCVNENSIMHSITTDKLESQFDMLDYIKSFLENRINGCVEIINKRKLNLSLMLLYCLCMEGNKSRYIELRSDVQKIEANHNKNTILPYRVLLVFDNYYLNRLLSYAIFVIKKIKGVLI